MCLICDHELSGEEMLKCLEEINYNKFVRWNITAVFRLRLAALGLNGPTVRNLAIEILDKFTKWRRTQPEHYIPITGIEEMTSVDTLEQDLYYIKRSSPDYTNKHSILEKYSEYIKSKFYTF